MGQNTFHGLSIGGTPEAPTIVNNSSAPVIAYVVQRFTTTGVNPTFIVQDFYSLVRGLPIGPLGIFIGLRKGVIDRATGKITAEGNPIRYELKAVLFSDGTHFGSDFDAISRIFYNVRNFAREMQYTLTGDRRTTLERESRAVQSIRSGPVSVGFPTLKDRSEMATALLDLPESEWEVAIARVASLPNVNKRRTGLIVSVLPGRGGL
jgi:hypothetical protein